MKTPPPAALRTLPVLLAAPFRFILAILIASALISSSALATLPGEWEGFGGPAGWDAPVGWEGPVLAMLGDGEDLVIGGEFSRIDLTDYRYLVIRDSSRFHFVGEGVPGPVYALLSTSGGLVAGGWWLGDLPKEYSSFVSRWDGAEWQKMSDGFNNRVNALAEFGGEVIAGGNFTRAGVTSVGRIARWDGEEWFPLGGAGFDGDVNALLVHEGDLLAAGEFTEVDGIPAIGLAVWDGSTWSAFSGGGIESGSWVQTLAVYNGDLVAGGSFQRIGGSAIPHLARWDGAAWQALGAGVNGQVRTLAVHGAYLAAGGVFDEAGGAPAGRVALWDGAGWHDLAGGADGEVSALASHDGKLFAGGWFHLIGGDSLAYFAFWDGASWGAFAAPDPPPGGMDNRVRALLETPEGLIVGGSFALAGSTAVMSAARLVGGEWEAMGTALGGSTVWEFYLFHDTVFAVGNGVQGVHRWDPGLGDWIVVGTGLNETVACIDEYDDHLIVGGNFTRTGAGDTVCYAARLVDSQWVPMGGLTGGTVRDFFHWKGELIAAGDIRADTAAGTQFDRVARWDGGKWLSMGSGMDDQVHALDDYQGDLLAGGYFDNAGGEPASKVARWDGQAWGPFTYRTIGSSGVEDLVVYNGELYALGGFTRASGEDVNCIVRWTGDVWEGLYGGMKYEGGYSASLYSGTVLDYGGSPALLVGGQFIKAGPVRTHRIALWRTPEIQTFVTSSNPPKRIGRILLGPNRPNPFNPSTAVDYWIPEAAAVSLTIHDISGRLVARLSSGDEQPGRHTVIWDGRSDAGRPVSSGIYFTKLKVGDRTETRKITLVR